MRTPFSTSQPFSGAEFFPTLRQPIQVFSVPKQLPSSGRFNGAHVVGDEVADVEAATGGRFGDGGIDTDIPPGHFFADQIVLAADPMHLQGDESIGSKIVDEVGHRFSVQPGA